MDLATLAAAAESADPPTGDGERYAGYGVMGLPFSSGHVLAMRRFPASSIGSGYTSVWHRTPAGQWSFWQNQAPEGGCSRYFSAEVSAVLETSVEVAWPQPDQIHVSVPEVGFDWRATMGTSARLQAFNALGSALPDRAWRSQRLLAVMGPVAGALLGFGSVTMTGRRRTDNRSWSTPASSGWSPTRRRRSPGWTSVALDRCRSRPRWATSCVLATASLLWVVRSSTDPNTVVLRR